MINFIKRKSEDLYPGYFAMIMATGALSLAAYYQGMFWISYALFVLNVFAYITLWFFTCVRIRFYFRRVVMDITNHARGPGFFTLVAGTCILGSQWIIIDQRYAPAAYLWMLSLVLWFVIMYTFFTAVTVRHNKPTLAEGINGAWLIAAVATQAVSILGTLLSLHAGSRAEIMLFISLCFYLLGCMLYLNIITLIFYRFTFIELNFSALTPPYWINMGAVAITTLSGSNLMLSEVKWPFLEGIRPFMQGFTLFFWVTGTWWIPLLLLLTLWRYLVHRYPLKYDPQMWGMAFPLSMYTICTHKLSAALQIPFLLVIPRVMLVIAAASWLIGFVSFIVHIVHPARSKALR